MSAQSQSDSLIDMAKSAISALIESAHTTDSPASPFAQNAQIYVNHAGPVSLDAFQATLAHKFGAAAGVQIEWKEIFEDAEAGVVAGFAVITRSMKFRIRVGPAQMLTSAMISLKLEEEDGKRVISQMFFTSTDKAAPIHLNPVA
ncbi:hypothetical protein CPB85DRAFT_1429803 [Mucidula mucida]|nr:hypothetical protein CPB85DRAFT_1429803 [Mucidula mucida]